MKFLDYFILVTTIIAMVFQAIFAITNTPTTPQTQHIFNLLLLSTIIDLEIYKRRNRE